MDPFQINPPLLNALVLLVLVGILRVCTLASSAWPESLRIEGSSTVEADEAHLMTAIEFKQDFALYLDASREFFDEWATISEVRPDAKLSRDAEGARICAVKLLLFLDLRLRRTHPTRVRSAWPRSSIYDRTTIDTTGKLRHISHAP